MEKWDNELRQQIIAGLITLGKKSEDQDDDAFVLESFYDHNLTVYLKNHNNQIIQGSRGTGKTHILRVLEMTLAKELDPRIHPIFIDCRTIGSGIYNTSEQSYPFDTPTRFFQYFLEKIHQKLVAFYGYQYLDDEPQLNSTVTRLLGDMRKSIWTKKEYVKSFSRTVGSGKDIKRASDKSLALSLRNSLDFSSIFRKEDAERETSESKQDIYVRYSADFPKFGAILEKLLTITDKKLFLLLDEWSSVPIAVQPYFAEFLRKTFFPISRVKFKIAVVPYRNRFRITVDEQNVGLEIGHDIGIALDLDRAYSVDKQPEELVKFCYFFLCRHLSAMLKSPIEPSDFIANMFDAAPTSLLLVRASEGNPRDFIDLLFKCVQNLFGSIDALITPRKVIVASDELLETTKLCDCDQNARELLNELIRYVVDIKKNRGFLIDRVFLGKSSALKNLIDTRVLHILDDNYRGYKDALSKSCVLLILNFGVYCNDLESGKPINFFYGTDVLERAIFPPPKQIDSPKELLHYDKNREFFACYINLVTGTGSRGTFDDNPFAKYFQFE